MRWPNLYAIAQVKVYGGRCAGLQRAGRLSAVAIFRSLYLSPYLNLYLSPYLNLYASWLNLNAATGPAERPGSPLKNRVWRHVKHIAPLLLLYELSFF